MEVINQVETPEDAAANCDRFIARLQAVVEERRALMASIRGGLDLSYLDPVARHQWLELARDCDRTMSTVDSCRASHQFKEVAAPIETLIVARNADLIMERATAELNGYLERFKVAYRVPADEPRLTGACVDLAHARNEAYKRDVGELPGDGGIWAAAVRFNVRALEVVQHRILQEATAEHVKSIESDLVKAVEKFRKINQLGVRHFGEDVEDWQPAPSTSELFCIGVAQ